MHDHGHLVWLFCPKENKLTWSGTLEDLKAFVLSMTDEQTVQNVTWHSPSEGKWCFDSKLLKIT